MKNRIKKRVNDNMGKNIKRKYENIKLKIKLMSNKQSVYYYYDKKRKKKREIVYNMKYSL